MTLELKMTSCAWPWESDVEESLSRRIRPLLTAPVWTEPAPREHEPGYGVQGDLGHSHHHHTPRWHLQVNDSPWLSVSRCGRVRQECGHQSRGGGGTARTGQGGAQHQITGVLEALVRPVLVLHVSLDWCGVCQRELSIRSVPTLSMRNSVSSLIMKWCVQSVSGAPGVLLLQHAVRGQPVGAPRGRLVQTRDQPAQAGQDTWPHRSDYYAKREKERAIYQLIFCLQTIV